MSAKTFASLCALCLFATASNASAQELLNPFSWFAPASYNNANCPNGQCNVNTGYRGAPVASGYAPANCANGFCATPTQNRGYPTANCPNGYCPTPNSGYTNYRPAQPAVNYNNQPYGNYQTYSAPTNYGPAPRMNNDYRYNAPMNVSQTPSRPTSNYGRPSYNGANSPFYP